MNCQELKHIPMREILSRLGYAPVRDQAESCWYESPFREERMASFHVKDKAWYDFGLGEGGNAIDFLRRYFRLGNVREVLEQARALLGSPGDSSFHQPKEVSQQTSKPTPALGIREMRALQSFGLMTYLLERGIDLTVAKKYLVEVCYESRGRSYCSLGFRNGSGGYELRSRVWKGSTGKDLTVFWGEGKENEVLVFEGFMDFLSLLTWLNLQAFEQSVLVLNSVALREKAAHVLQASGFERIHLYLDNDPPGEDATRYFLDAFPGKALDQSSLYADHKDLNDLLRRERC